MQTRDYRRHQRKIVDRVASLTFGNCVVAGNVRDVSAGGIFFEPWDGLVDGEYIHGDDCLNSIDQNVMIMMDGQHKSGQIKWMGQQPTYNCLGVGIEFV